MQAGKMVAVVVLTVFSLTIGSRERVYAASTGLDPEKLYRIIARKVNMNKAEVPTFESSQKLEHKGKFCEMTLTWSNVSCTDIYSLHLKDFDSKLLGTRMSNIYPRITLKTTDLTKHIKHKRQCVDGEASKDEMLDKVSFDLRRPGGLDVYKTAAAFIHLIRHCGGK